MNRLGRISLLISVILLFTHKGTDASPAESENDSQSSTQFAKLPTVLMVLLFRNKAHTMPYFLNFIHRLDYPKDRISLWIRSDHNEDKTLEVLHNWLSSFSFQYHSVNVEYDKQSKRRTGEVSPTHWTPERHADLIRLKEEALDHARAIWADYVFLLDADALLFKPNVLRDLIRLDRPVVAPMLGSETFYSNFWCGMTADYYYLRTEQYRKIYDFEVRGEFSVPMVHSAVLINLNDKRNDFLTFNKTILKERFNLSTAQIGRIPDDDIIIFSLSANFSHVPLTITNDDTFGYILVPLDVEDDVAKDHQQMKNAKVYILNELDAEALELPRELEMFVEYPQPDKITLDAIYMINLERRPERRRKMERSFKELGLVVEHVAAFDGQELTDDFLSELGVRFLPGYADPFHGRPMTKGEIGCFLSHFYIWERMSKDNIYEALVLEDDIRFEPYFKERAYSIIEEARRIGNWDLIYFGRKRLMSQEERLVGDSEQLVHAGYSYWTLGYLLSLQGARKLLGARPLENLIPVDEFLPVMFDRHVNETWKAPFPNRNLIAWSASPLIVFPTHYTGESGYFSDTEESDLVVLNEADDDDEDRPEKKGRKENPNQQGKATEEADSSQSVDELIQNDDSIDTNFVVNEMTEHVRINQEQAEPRSEL